MTLRIGDKVIPLGARNDEPDFKAGEVVRLSPHSAAVDVRIDGGYIERDYPIDQLEKVDDESTNPFVQATRDLLESHLEHSRKMLRTHEFNSDDLANTKPKDRRIKDVRCFCCGNKVEKVQQIENIFGESVMVVVKCCGHEERKDFTFDLITKINEAGGWTAFLK